MLGLVLMVLVVLGWVVDEQVILLILDNFSYVVQVQSIFSVEKLIKGQVGVSGLFEGQSLILIICNFYLWENMKDSFIFCIFKVGGGFQCIYQCNVWVQGMVFKYSLGYIQGSIGFGFDVVVFNEIVLECGKGCIGGGGNWILVNSDGEVIGEWFKLGVVNICLCVLNIEFKVGCFLVNILVFSYIDNCVLFFSFIGFVVISEELDNFSLQVGSFCKVSLWIGFGDEDMIIEYGICQVKGDCLNYLGGNYKLFDGLEIFFYGLYFQDVWNQYYLGVIYDIGDFENGIVLCIVFNGYYIGDIGVCEVGYIDNDIWSLVFIFGYCVYVLILVYQQVDGNEYFDYVYEILVIFLVNLMLVDYNSFNEKFVQICYEIDWSYYGVFGLSIGVWYVKGWDIDGIYYDGDCNGVYGNYVEVCVQDGEKYYELGLMVVYKVQNGLIKDSIFKFIYMMYKVSQNQVDGSVNELCLVSIFFFNLL